MSCVTHHHACACREASTKKALRAAQAREREAVELLSEFIHSRDGSKVAGSWAKLVERANAFLAKGET